MTTITTDNYITRVDTQPHISERKDPVVYGQAPGPLSPNEVSSFKNNGYLFFDSFFSGEELEVMQKNQLTLKSDNLHKSTPEIVFELENKVKTIRSIFDIHRSDTYIQRLAKTPKLTQMIKQLLDSDLYIHQSRINYKPAFRGKEFYWHSDFETWHSEDGMPHMRAISCSILLSENTAYNGALMLIPGSHHYFISCTGHTPENHYKDSLRKQEYGVPDDENLTHLMKKHGIVSPLGGAGSVLLFDCNILHGSNSNISPTPRTNLFFVYNSIHNIVQAPFGKTKPRPEYIANRTNLCLV